MFSVSIQHVEPLDNSEDDFVAMGTYQILDAQKLLEAFEATGIEYQVEFTDGLANMNPLVAAEGGSYGTAAGITVYVRQDQRESADKLYFGLFGDFLPNYESPFFDNPENVEENPPDPL